MKRILVAVTGPDSFGVVYTTSDTLNKLGCSIIDMDQTTVRNEYSAIMIVDKPESVGDDEVAKIIKEALKGKGFDMSVLVRDYVPGEATVTQGEPFVLTVDGTDSRDILTAFTRVFYEGRINIDSFRTIEVKLDDAGNPLPQPRVLLVFEVTVPPEVDRKALSRTLSDIAHDRHLSMRMQHRRIFEAVHRVSIA